PDLSASLAIEHSRPHRALSDASATGDLFVELVHVFNGLDRLTAREIRRVAAQTPGPLDAFFNGVALASAPATSHGAASLPSARPPALLDAVSPPRAAGSGGAAVGSMPLADAAAALLGADGPLAGQPSYELREGQITMARAVGQTLDRRRRLLVEA